MDNRGRVTAIFRCLIIKGQFNPRCSNKGGSWSKVSFALPYPHLIILKGWCEKMTISVHKDGFAAINTDGSELLRELTQQAHSPLVRSVIVTMYSADEFAYLLLWTTWKRYGDKDLLVKMTQTWYDEFVRDAIANYNEGR